MRSLHAQAVAGLEALCFPCGWSAEQYRAAMEQGTCWGCVCFEGPGQDGNLVGYIACESVLEEMEILNVAVRPDRRGQGVASALLGAVLQEARERNIVSCLLEVREGNVPALALYKHAGFRQVGLRKKYYADNGENAVVMAAVL